MINIDFGITLVLLIFGLIAAFGYYGGFLALLNRRLRLENGRVLKGKLAVAVGISQVVGSILVSAVAIFFYFSRIK